MDEFIKFYNQYTTEINTLAGIIGGGIVTLLFKLFEKRKKVKEAKERQLDTYFQDNLVSIYIPMNVKDVQSGGKVFRFFEHFAEIIQKEPIESRYICLLGDIGSGKTAALTHLHQWYIDKYSAESSMPKDIRLYTLNKGYQTFWIG